MSASGEPVEVVNVIVDELAFRPPLGVELEELEHATSAKNRATAPTLRTRKDMRSPLSAQANLFPILQSTAAWRLPPGISG
jgi:hypothetical protein